MEKGSSSLLMLRGRSENKGAEKKKEEDEIEQRRKGGVRRAVKMENEQTGERKEKELVYNSGVTHVRIPASLELRYDAHAFNIYI